MIRELEDGIFVIYLDQIHQKLNAYLFLAFHRI